MLKILIPTDGSPHALLAVHHALRLVAAGLKARFVVANVQESATLYELVVAHDPNVLQKVSEGAGRDLVRQAMGLLAAAGTLTIIPGAIVIYFVRNYIAKGFALGRV